jgi:hypothetical protein
MFLCLGCGTLRILSYLVPPIIVVLAGIAGGHVVMDMGVAE